MQRSHLCGSESPDNGLKNVRATVIFDQCPKLARDLPVFPPVIPTNGNNDQAQSRLHTKSQSTRREISLGSEPLHLFQEHDHLPPKQSMRTVPSKKNSACIAQQFWEEGNQQISTLESAQNGMYELYLGRG